MQMYMNALRVETCMLYMYFKETSLISHASLESSNKESINQKLANLKSLHHFHVKEYCVSVSSILNRPVKGNTFYCY